METKIENKLMQLKKSSFRSKFHLTEKERRYIQEKGMDTIVKHAYDFIEKRIAPSVISNDGKQTPMKGHPVFLAQHATATCCRNCLWKWHHIEKGKELTKEEINYIVTLIMNWIKEEQNSRE